MRTAIVLTLAFAMSTAVAFATEVEENESNEPAKVKPSFSGRAHWYGKELHGRRTASGAVFDKDKLTAAHPNLKFGTKVRVVSKVTRKEVVVEINDRCPAMEQRCIDLSEQAAKEIGIWPHGRNAVDCYVVSRSRTKK